MARVTSPAFASIIPAVFISQSSGAVVGTTASIVLPAPGVGFRYLISGWGAAVNVNGAAGAFVSSAFLEFAAVRRSAYPFAFPAGAFANENFSENMLDILIDENQAVTVAFGSSIANVTQIVNVTYCIVQT